MGVQRAAEVARIAELVRVNLVDPDSGQGFLGGLLRCGVCAASVATTGPSFRLGPQSVPGDGVYYQCQRTKEHVDLPLRKVDGLLQRFTVARLSEPTLGPRLRARRIIELEEQIDQLAELLAWRQKASWRSRRALYRMLDGTRYHYDQWSAWTWLEDRHRSLNDDRDYLKAKSWPPLNEALLQDWSSQPFTQMTRRRLLLRTAAGADQIMIDTDPVSNPNPRIRVVPATLPDTIGSERIDDYAAILARPVAPAPTASPPAAVRALPPLTGLENRATRRFREREERRLRQMRRDIS